MLVLTVGDAAVMEGGQRREDGDGVVASDSNRTQYRARARARARVRAKGRARYEEECEAMSWRLREPVETATAMATRAKEG